MFSCLAPIAFVCFLGVLWCAFRFGSPLLLVIGVIGTLISGILSLFVLVGREVEDYRTWLEQRWRKQSRK